MRVRPAHVRALVCCCVLSSLSPACGADSATTDETPGAPQGDRGASGRAGGASTGGSAGSSGNAGGGGARPAGGSGGQPSSKGGAPGSGGQGAQGGFPGSGLAGASAQGGAAGQATAGSAGFPSSAGQAGASGSAGAPPMVVCGNAACDPGETCESCAADCGACPAPGSATITGPLFALSADSAQNAPPGLNTIVAPTYAMAVGDPSTVASVTLEMAPAGDPSAWAAQTGWADPPSAQWSHPVPCPAAGAFLVRIAVTSKSGATYQSPPHAIECRKHTIEAFADNASPVVGAAASLTAAMSPPAAPGFPNTPDGWFANREGAGWVKQDASNPISWTPADTASHDWVWVEMFPDGSRLHSNAVHITPQPPSAPTEVLVSGGDCNAMQAGLDQAAAAGLPLRFTGAFTVDCVVRIPDNVQIGAHDATFTFTKAGRIRNKTNGAGGGYGHAGGFVWDGGTFAGAGNGVFTISHSPGFTIKNTVQYAYADANDDGHSIEINSSGGKHTPGTYTVHILDNAFRGVTGQRANANDEPVQYDFAWDGSGGDAPYDATMSHNIRIAGNTFHRLDESGTWQFALCAIGGHRGSAGEPAERHNGILIENNQIHGAVGATANVSPDKGAIALWNARDVWIRDNAFFGCTGSRLVSGWDANPDRNLNDATMNINISNNTHNGASVTISMPSSNTTGG